jgi:hypothetical protein
MNVNELPFTSNGRDTRISLLQIEGWMRVVRPR